jgi:uncharacterized DUF497 family protein
VGERCFAHALLTKNKGRSSETQVPAGGSCWLYAVAGAIGCIMKYIWKEEKNTLLKETRNVSFEQVVIAIEEKRIVDVIEHPNQEKYKGQIFILVDMSNYVYVVPAYIDGENCYLKTIYPSRKYTERYLRNG